MKLTRTHERAAVVRIPSLSYRILRKKAH